MSTPENTSKNIDLLEKVRRSMRLRTAQTIGKGV